MRPPPSNARDGSHGRTRQYVPGSDKRPLPVRGSKAPKAALKGRGPPFPSAGERGPPRPHKPTAGFRKGREAPHPRTGRPAPVRGTPISARPPFAEGQLRVNEIPWRQHGGQCVPKCARQAGAVANGPCERRQHGRHVTDASEACRHDYFHASPGRKTPAEAPPGNHMHLEREVRPGTCAEEDCAAGISRARWTAGRSSAPLRLLGDASCFKRNGGRSRQRQEGGGASRPCVRVLPVPPFSPLTRERRACNPSRAYVFGGWYGASPSFRSWPRRAAPLRPKPIRAGSRRVRSVWQSDSAARETAALNFKTYALHVGVIPDRLPGPLNAACAKKRRVSHGWSDDDSRPVQPFNLRSPRRGGV